MLIASVAQGAMLVSAFASTARLLVLIVTVVASLAAVAVWARRILRQAYAAIASLSDINQVVALVNLAHIIHHCHQQQQPALRRSATLLLILPEAVVLLSFLPAHSRWQFALGVADVRNPVTIVFSTYGKRDSTV